MGALCENPVVAVTCMSTFITLLSVQSLRRFLAVVDMSIFELLPGVLKAFRFALPMIGLLLVFRLSGWHMAAIVSYGLGCLVIGFYVLVKRVSLS